MVGCLDSVGVMLPILKGQVADRQLLVSTDAQLPAV